MTFNDNARIDTSKVQRRRGGRTAAIGGGSLIGVLVLFLDRPMRMGSVVATVVVVLLALLAIGLVRRPEPAAALIEEPEPEARER